ncbi:polysaccharide biosynthesis protein [Sinirhodobacter sp. WL0062]|uniref:Polysaccharide biosynthesis protein n=1 Tax=Rhodobacter flavimaris TaxID=2907145 RepID=A0ABS8YWX1_9RHOB|nr:polysaccharide biosynthesis protein [Sinirhodobacter sp. WL0062]MCE5973635.1 polysaccharide biosynthesis protein [Sinirhodobacter sp. WL0062]
MATELRARRDISVVAFLDDNPELHGATLNGIQVCAPTRLDRLIAARRIERVILAMPALSEPGRGGLLRRLAELGVEVDYLSTFPEAAIDRSDQPLAPDTLLGRPAMDGSLPLGGDAYRARSVLITGAGGTIGSELCRQIVQCGPAKLVLLDLSEAALYRITTDLRPLAETFGVELVSVLGSVMDAPHMASILSRHGVEVVLHAAAYKHVPIVEENARVGLANNALGTAVVARAARAAGVARFVLVSSDKAVRPGSLMGASKRFAELAVQDLAAREGATLFSIVRFGNVLGSSGSVVPLFQGQIARGGPVTLTDERATRYFMTIPEAARLVLTAGALAEGGELFVLDMGAPVRIGELARQMIRGAGYSVRDAAHPDGDIEIRVIGLRPGEKLHEELMVRTGAQLTAHPKIIRVHEDHLSELEMAAALRDLRNAVECGADTAAIDVVRRTVRDYAPQGHQNDATALRLVHPCYPGE